MNQEIKEEWLKRLRSGYIPQVKGALAINEGRCCLGVLCDIGVERGLLTVTEDQTSRGDIYRYYSYPKPEGHIQEPYEDPELFRSSALLPRAFAQAIGIGDVQDIEVSAEKGENLATLNDYGLSFHQIADIAEVFA